jgi:hypothetical protein
MRPLILGYAIVACLSACNGSSLHGLTNKADAAVDAQYAPADVAADVAADGADAAIETRGADAVPIRDTSPLPVDAIDGGVASLAGLRIAFVGTENPTSELSLVTWLGQTTGVVAARIQTSGTALTAEILSGYDVLILERLVRTYSQAEAALLTSWVNGGGAVMSVSGFYSSGSDTTNTNSLLSGIGIEYGAFLLGGTGSPAYTSDLANHPIMAGIASLPFWGGFTVQPSAIADGVGINTTLATATAQPICVAQVRGQGRVLVWGDEWIEIDSAFATSDVQRFWQQTLTWLARR